MTRGVVSGFSRITTSASDDVDQSTLSVSTAVEAMSAIKTLASTVATDGSAVMLELEAHERDVSPHVITLTDTDVDVLRDAISSLLIHDDMVIIDPTMSITKSVARTICHRNTLQNTTIHVQYINERTYVQMFNAYSPTVIVPEGVTMSTTMVGSVTMPSFEAPTFSVPTMSDEYTIAFYVAVPDGVIATISSDTLESTEIRHGSFTNSPVFIRRVSDNIFGVYLFETGDASINRNIHVTMNDASTPRIIGLRTYPSHSIVDGIRAIGIVDETMVVPIPVEGGLTNEGYSIGVSYLPGLDISGAWLCIGSLVSIEIVNNTKRVTLTDGDVIAQRNFPINKTAHGTSIFTFYPKRIEWLDNNGNTLALNCTTEIYRPTGITFAANDGYVGSIVCSTPSMMETIQNHLNKKG